MEPFDVVTRGGHPAELGSCAMCAMWRHNAVKPDASYARSTQK